MKTTYRLQLEAKKNRLKRRAGEVVRETARALLLMGVIVAATAVLLTAFDYVVRSPYLSIRETVVRGCKELTEKDIMALAAVQSAPNILSLNLDAIARRIGVNPWIRNVSIGRISEKRRMHSRFRFLKTRSPFEEQFEKSNTVFAGS